MTASCPEDFARGCAAGYRAAIVACWRHLENLEPEMRDACAKALLAGLEREIVNSLHNALEPDEYLSGLLAIEDALRELICAPEVSST